MLANQAIDSLQFPGTRIRELARKYAPMLVVLCLYGSMYLYLYRRFPMPATNPYHLVLGIGSFFSGMEYYLGMLSYVGSFRVALAAGFLVMLLVSTAMRWKAESAGWLGFVLFLLPVSFIPDHRTPLYLYLPSAFFWIGSIAFGRRFLSWLAGLTQFSRAHTAAIEPLLIAVAVLAIPGSTGFTSA